MKLKSNLNLVLTGFLNKLPRILILFLLVNVVIVSKAQSGEATEKEYHLSGDISATNNGISVIPSFSLGKPAVIFELAAGGEKLTFEPQFKFSMKAKPWSFVFWWRYKLVDNEKFGLRVGAHPAFMFADLSYQEEGRSVETIKVRRLLGTEIAPSFRMSDKVTLRPYTIIGHGFDGGTKNTIYLTFITSISDLGITDHINFSMSPQLFFLKMDENHGYYCSSSFSLEHDKCPVSLSSMFNYKINSSIASEDFLWNVSLVYKFDTKLRKL